MCIGNNEKRILIFVIKGESDVESNVNLNIIFFKYTYHEPMTPALTQGVLEPPIHSSHNLFIKFFMFYKKKFI